MPRRDMGVMGLGLGKRSHSMTVLQRREESFSWDEEGEDQYGRSLSNPPGKTDGVESALGLPSQ